MKELSVEEKELLLRDLCARLPYGIWVQSYHSDGGIEGKGTFNFQINIDSENPMTSLMQLLEYSNCKPYLRPMSSMTEEEMVEFKWLNGECDAMPTFKYVLVKNYRIFDWLNRHHFDYRGLIEKGLAIEAPKGMYNLKNK